MQAYIRTYICKCMLINTYLSVHLFISMYCTHVVAMSVCKCMRWYMSMYIRMYVYGCMHACVCVYAYMRTGVPSSCAALAMLCNQVVRCVPGCPVTHPDKTYPKLYTPAYSAVAPFHLADAGRSDDVQHA